MQIVTGKVRITKKFGDHKNYEPWRGSSFASGGPYAINQSHMILKYARSSLNWTKSLLKIGDISFNKYE